MEPQAPRPLGPRYASIFALVFCALLVAPLFKSGISVAYLSQDFLGREQLIEAFNTVRLQLGDRVFPQVLVGKEGWMYLYSVSEIGDYQHSNQFATKHEMAYYQMQLDMINARLKKQGIKFLVVIPPDKASIYPQYVPDEIKVFPGPSRLDQFIHFMHQRGKTQILDLRPALQEASKSQQVYYKTDAHYTYIAWYIAYEQILSTLSQWYPELKPRPLSDFRVVSGKPRTMQLPELMGLPYIQEDTRGLVPRFPTGVHTMQIPLPEHPGQRIELAINDDQSLPKLLILHDSFLVTSIPMLEPHFRETTSVFRSNDPDIWNIDWVDAEKPDIVILEFTQFYMNFMDKSIPAGVNP